LLAKLQVAKTTWHFVPDFLQIRKRSLKRKWEFKNDQLILSAQGLQAGNEKAGAYLVWQRV
jgi:hypothetical protein